MLAGADPFRNPVLQSLTGPHRGWAEQRGRVLRYPPDVAPFLAVPDDATPEDWADAANLLGRGSGFLVGGSARSVPASWREVESLEAYLMAPEERIGAPAAAVRRLGARDRPAMLDLAAAARPGPFAARAADLGEFVGIEEDGALVAMGGTRLRGARWVEISAVCTAPAARGRGFASAIVRHLAGIVERDGRTPMLYVVTDNPAHALYEQLGFRTLRVEPGKVVRPPRA